MKDKIATRTYGYLGLFAMCTILFHVQGVAQSQAPVAQKNEDVQPATIASQKAPSKYAFGDWGGKRTSLEQHGVTFDGIYVVDMLSNTTGGIEQANTAWGRIRLTADADMEKLVGWKGAAIHARGFWQYGANLGSQYIGSVANPSSLVSSHALRLDSYWLEQGFLKKSLTIRVGQFAGQDFYGVREYGGSFLAEPMGYAFGNLFTNVYESYDPASTPAAEVRIAPTPHYYFKTAVLAGNRDPYKEDDNGMHFTIKNGVVWVGEAGYKVNPTTAVDGTALTPAHNLPGTYKVGAIFNNGKFTNPSTNVTTNGNYLVYFEGSQAVTRESKLGVDSHRGLDLTFGVSGSPEDVSKVHLQWTAGARYTGAIRPRPNDEINLGFIQSKISSNFNTVSQAYSDEEVVELNYRALIRPWLVFQPDFQYYVNPGALKTNSRNNAAVLGFRTLITF